MYLYNTRAVMYKSKCLKMIRNLNWKYTCCPSVPHSARSSSTEARSAAFYLSAPSSHTLFYSPSSETACRDGTETNSERRKGGANASICMYVATTYNNATRSSTIGEYIAEASSLIVHTRIHKVEQAALVIRHDYT